MGADTVQMETLSDQKIAGAVGGAGDKLTFLKCLKRFYLKENLWTHLSVSIGVTGAIMD